MLALGRLGQGEAKLWRTGMYKSRDMVLGVCQIGPDVHKSQSGCEMDWTRSWHLLVHMRAESRQGQLCDRAGHCLDAGFPYLYTSSSPSSSTYHPVIGEEAEDVSSTLASATRVEDQHGIPVSCGYWGMGQQMEDLSFPLSCFFR